MSSNDLKRPSNSDEKPKKRRKKNPYGGDVLMQIAAGYANNTLPTRALKPETTPVAEEKKKAAPRARGGFSSLVAKEDDPPASETDGAENGDANDGMKGDEKFFASRRLLPVWNARHDILTALERNDVLILTGEAGSGKSTQVPQVLSSAPWCTNMVAVTQPRRIAATSLAYRVADEMGTPLGKGSGTGSVGYSVRFDTRVPKGARIKYLTEGRLLQEFLGDQSLSQYSAIIVDEVHERSINADLIMGFLRLIQDANRSRAAQESESASGGDPNQSKLKRPSSSSLAPLKVVLMSATADVERLQKLFATQSSEDAAQRSDADQSPAEEETPATAQVSSAEEMTPATSGAAPLDKVEVIRVSGRQFPIEIIYEKHPIASYVASVVQTVMKINKGEQFPGDILVFLPGQEEIHRVISGIKTEAAEMSLSIPRLEVLPLYSQLPKDKQQKALGPVRQRFTRKVILATNIAETSVTVPGVRFVIDSGMAKINWFDPVKKRGLLGNLPISKSSAVQRAGRAGREGPGKCFRLYTQRSFDELEAADTPEILRVDVADALLAMLASGVADPFQFPLLSKPSKAAMAEGLVQLMGLGAIDERLKITADGITMSKMPLPVTYGRVLLEAAREGCLLEVIDVVACLTMNGPVFLNPSNQEASGTTSSNAKGKKGGQKDGQEDGREDDQKNGLAIGQKSSDKTDGEHGEDGEDGEDDEDDDTPQAIKEILHARGDLLTYHTTLNKMLEQRDRKWSSWCRDRLVHEGNLRQALRIRRQLQLLCAGLGFLADDAADDKWGHPKYSPLGEEKEDRILKCFLRAFAFNSAERQADGSYATHTGKKVLIHPSSVLSGWRLGTRGPPAILYMEQVETKRNYARVVSSVDPGWIASARGHWD